MIIGNLTRDPDLRYTQGGTSIASFGVATNRSWTNNNQEKQEAVEFHNIVIWGKLAEIASNLLTKGSKVYLSGRLQTRKWQTKDGQDRYTTEIVADEMILLRGGKNSNDDSEDVPEPEAPEAEDISDEVPF